MATLTKVKDILAYRDKQQYCGPEPSCVLLDDGIILLAFRRAYIEPIFPEWPSPAGLRASAIPLRDGGIGVAVYGHMRAKCEATNVWFMVSQDGGLTWRARGRIFRRYFPRPHRRYPGAAMIEQTTRYQEREIAHV